MVKPAKNQIMFQELELGMFFHFGIRTFNEGHKDWDRIAMDVNSFNPTDLDCDQWIRTAKEAGFKYAVMTTKHHDGFNLWPSKYTEYSVKNSPWKDGKGDVVQEFVDACRKHDMKIGLYYSPADFNMFEADMSEEEYNSFIRNQLTELMSNYGVIDLVWFDGCGSERCNYHWDEILKCARDLQPNLLVFNMGDPDYRWVGNESGIAPKPCFNVVKDVHFSIQTEEKDSLGDGADKWLPAECDCRLRKNNWFYSDFDEDTIKSVDELMGLYYLSVGRNANLLINIAPNREGKIPEKDRLRMLEFGDEIRRRFSNPVAQKEDFITEEGKYIYRKEEGKLVNTVVIKENIENGESVTKFKVKGVPYPYSSEKIVFFDGDNIGHKVICSFPTICLREVEIDIEESQGEVVIDDINMYYVKPE